MKNSKYRNTGLLFELLTRQITTDILNNESSSKASAILKKHFNKKSQLFKENQLFNVILESKFKDENKATHLVETTQKAYSKVINLKNIKIEKYNLIKSIKENFNLEDFFKSRVTNYRLLAAIHNVISENYENPVVSSKSHFTLLEYMTRKSESKESEILQSLRKENKDLRHITYKILVEKFNNKYTKIILGFFCSVVIYYLTNFFYVLGSTEKINLAVSIASPLLILFLINIYFVRNINAK